MYSAFAWALMLSGAPMIDSTSSLAIPIRMPLSFAEESGACGKFCGLRVAAATGALAADELVGLDSQAARSMPASDMTIGAISGFTLRANQH